MMKQTIECLDPKDIESLLSGDMGLGRQAEFEQHLADCPTCCNRLQEAVGNNDWWDEIEASLQNVMLAVWHDPENSTGDSIGYGAFDARARGKSRSTSSILKLLGPTDDPQMLGRIGSYEIVGLLGQGGMGAVFKGFDRTLDRFVAIKVLLPHLASSGAARKRFAREGKAIAAVVDDHVMAIYCVDEWQGLPYLVMNYSRGLSLQKRLNDSGPMELREILRIGMQAAKGLAAAHSQGIVHRDIKPANIFLDQTVEHVQLMDFGLARAVDDASLTRSGTLAGTPQYMSPEQARAEAVDHRSDLFSLGSVMYAMCTGHPPFRTDSSYGVLRLIIEKEPRSVRESNPDVPDWLCCIIAKLMAKKPDDRFTSAKVVAELLENCLAHVQSPSTVDLPASLTESTKRCYPFTKSVLIGAIAMSCLALVSVLMFMQTSVPPIGNAAEGKQGVLAQKDTESQPSNLEAEIRIAGKCIDESGRPIENAIIELYENDRLKFKPITTGADGAFDFGTVPDPELSMDSYVHYLVVGRATGKAIGAAVPFGYSGKSSELKIELGAPGQLKGKITGPDGLPVSGAKVSTAGLPWIDGVHGATTNANGEYVLDAMPLLEHPGMSRLRGPGLPKEGTMIPVAQQYMIVQHPSYGLFQPGYAECPATVDVTLDEPAIVKGRVVDEQGKPIAGIKVSASHSKDPTHRHLVAQSQLRGMSHGSAETNADGEYSIMLQYSGPIELTFGGATHFAKSVNDVVVASGETVDAPEVTAVEPAYVVGRIVDVDTDKTVACPPGVRLRVYSMGDGPVGSVIVQPDGTFRLPVLPGKTFVYFSIAPDSMRELTKLWDVLDHPNPLTAKQYPVEADRNKEVEVNFPVKVNKEKLGQVMQRLQGEWEIQSGTYVAGGNARQALTSDRLLDGDKRPFRFTIHGNQWLGHSANLCGAPEPELEIAFCRGVAELTIDESASAPCLTLKRFEEGKKRSYPCLYQLKGDQLELICNAFSSNQHRPVSRDLLNDGFILVAKRLRQ